MGIITECTLKTFEETTDRWLGAYTFASMEEGLKTMQKFIRTGWNPAVTRLHDPIEAERSYPNYVEEGESILLIISERSEERRVGKECRSSWSVYSGEKRKINR